MKKIKCRLIKTVHSGYSTKVLLMFLISYLFTIQHSQCTSYISLNLDAIQFNYDDESPADALTIRASDGSELTLPEWTSGGNRNEFAYIMNQTNRSVQVRFESNCTDMHLLINLEIVSGDGIGEVCNFFVANYEELSWITLPLNGSIPSSVGDRDFTWQWDVYAIPIDITYCSKSFTFNTEHSYYTLLAEPQVPMMEPWTSVLDYACNWASGQITEYGIVWNVTEKAYTELGKIYDPDQTHATFPGFGLKSFLEE